MSGEMGLDGVRGQGEGVKLVAGRVVSGGAVRGQVQPLILRSHFYAEESLLLDDLYFYQAV